LNYSRREIRGHIAAPLLHRPVRRRQPVILQYTSFLCGGQQINY